MLPNIYFLIGPKSSGKSTLGLALADRTNMQVLSFHKFVRDHNLKDADCETKTAHLIKHLVNETAPRILIEDFPQSDI